MSDANWSWRPGLPTLGSQLELWCIDDTRDPKDPSEYELQFLVNVDIGFIQTFIEFIIPVVHYDVFASYLLRNIGTGPVTMVDKGLRRKNHKRQIVETKNKPIPIKQWELVDSPTGSLIRSVPICMQTTHPQKLGAPSENIEEAAQYLRSEKMAEGDTSA